MQILSSILMHVQKYSFSCYLYELFPNLEPNIHVDLLFLQVRAFSQLQFHDGKQMKGTFRPVQPLNGRKVFRSGGAVILANSALLLATIAMGMGLSQPI